MQSVLGGDGESFGIYGASNQRGSCFFLISNKTCHNTEYFLTVLLTWCLKEHPQVSDASSSSNTVGFCHVAKHQYPKNDLWLKKKQTKTSL